MADHGGPRATEPTERRPSPGATMSRTAELGLLGGAAALGTASVHLAYGWDAVALWLPDLIVGLTFVGGGVLAWQRSRAAATLLLAAGFAWFAGNLDPAAVAWHRGPVLHLLFSFPAWRPRARVDAIAVGVGYAASIVPGGWRSETVLVAFALVLLVRLCLAYVRADRRDRSFRAAAMLAGLALAAVTVAGSVARQSWPDGAAVVPALLAYEAALILVTVALVTVLRRTVTPEVTDLVVELDETRSGTLRDALAAMLHDPRLEIGYWSTRERRYLDARGKAVAPPTGPDRMATRVGRGEAPLALLVHDRAVLEDAALTDAVAVAARLAGDNAALQAGVRDQLEELTASRRRLLLAADEQRHALARRLRAGPVRRLESLRDALGAVRPGLHDRHLVKAGEHVADTLAVVDELARGLHPLELANGLAVALAGLAERSPVPIRLTVTNTRFPPEHEVAGWYTCVEAVSNATKHAEPSLVTVSVRQQAGHLVVDVADDGRGGARPDGTGLRGLADRLDALGGTLTVDTAPGRGTVLTAKLPLPGDPA
jgi:signal transduction histidine kinase